MKFGVTVLLVICVLSGCSQKNDQLKQATELRNSILSSSSCNFEAIITADYGDVIYSFQMGCHVDEKGNLSFSVKDPESIAGITGQISKENAALTFDDKILAFPLLADGQLTPVSAPWIFYSTLRSGYISGCSGYGDGLCLYIDDSYEENPLHLEIYTDSKLQPIHADFFWNHQRVLSADIRNFTIQ